MAARRILVLIAVLLGFTALAASLSPPEPRRVPSGDVSVAPQREPAETDANVQVVTTAESDQEIDAEVGRRLRIEVTSPDLGSVQLGDGGPIESVQPESPARFDLLPDRQGEIELSVVEPRRVIARVLVR